jgi:hypothetical protein
MACTSRGPSPAKTRLTRPNADTRRRAVFGHQPDTETPEASRASGAWFKWFSQRAIFVASQDLNLEPSGYEPDELRGCPAGMGYYSAKRSGAPGDPLPGIVEPEAALFIGGPIPVRSILKRSASFNRPAGLAFMPARRWLVFLPLVRLRAGPIQPV